MKKLIRIFPLALFAMVLIMSSCKDEVELLPPDYFPLRVGNVWVYDVHFIYPDNEYYSRTITKNVIGTEVIDGNEFFKIETVSSTGAPVSSIEYIRNASGYYLDENGDNWIYLEGELNEVVSSSVDSFPAWEVYFENSIVSESEKINVAAGAFDCLKYQTKIFTTNPNVNWEAKFDDFYFADGVGLVKYHNHSIYGGFFTEYELKYYDVE